MTFSSSFSASLDISTINTLFFVQSFASTCVQLPGNKYWSSTSSNVLNESWSTVQTAENQSRAQRSNVQRMCSPGQNDDCRVLKFVSICFRRMPEMVAPRTLVFRPLVNGNEDSGNEFAFESNLWNILFLVFSSQKLTQSLKMQASNLSAEPVNWTYVLLYCLKSNATIFISRVHLVKCSCALASTHVQEEPACALGCCGS